MNFNIARPSVSFMGGPAEGGKALRARMAQMTRENREALNQAKPLLKTALAEKGFNLDQVSIAVIGDRITIIVPQSWDKSKSGDFTQALHQAINKLPETHAQVKSLFNTPQKVTL